jgi:ribonuclease E
MMPGMDNFGVSRKIEDEVERRRLRRILDELDPVEGVGFIVRTAGMGKTKEEIQRDLVYLTRLWHQMQRTIRERRAPVELYTEGDLVTRTVRDAYTPDIQRIVVDQLDVARRIRDFFKLTTPETARLVEYYDGSGEAAVQLGWDAGPHRVVIPLLFDSVAFSAR